MEDNPYTTFVQYVRKEQENGLPILFREGKVVNVSPLRIEICNTIQQNVFRKNADLKDIEAGDTLLMMSEGDQRFIILCKVVGA